MTGDTNNLEIWAPLVDNLLSILNALQIDLLVIGAKGALPVLECVDFVL